MHIRSLLVIILIHAIPVAKSQDLNAYAFADFREGKNILPYRMLMPVSFDSSKKYPLLVFLHGAFEKGSDNQSQLSIGGRYFLYKENRERFPAIIIFPQCPELDSWAYFETQIDSATGLVNKWNFPFKKEPTTTTALLKHLLDSLVALKYLDPSRVYIGGISQGGMGVFDMAARYPDLFAAAFPICGAGRINTAKNFSGKVAVWIFHGEKDEIVPVRFSREYFKQLQKQGADVRYTEYPGVFHNSWVNALNEPELLTWLFSKSKKQKEE